jgi:hypothetical protein
MFYVSKKYIYVLNTKGTSIILEEAPKHKWKGRMKVETKKRKKGI